MKLGRINSLIACFCLLIGLNCGCLSLSMLNREAPDTKQRLDYLEHRVSTLEGTTTLPSGLTAVAPETTPRNPPGITLQ